MPKTAALILQSSDDQRGFSLWALLAIYSIGKRNQIAPDRSASCHSVDDIGVVRTLLRVGCRTALGANVFKIPS